jgi:hypothetical protein
VLQAVVTDQNVGVRIPLQQGVCRPLSGFGDKYRRLGAAANQRGFVANILRSAGWCDFPATRM